MRPSGREQPRQSDASERTPPRTQRGDPKDIAPDALAAGYERLDVAPRSVVWALAALGLLVVIAVGVVWAFSAVHESRRAPPPRATLATRAVEPPAPRLEANPVAGGAAVIARSTADIERYGWVDEAERIARVPIEEAMRLLAARGWPDVFDPSGAASADDPAERSPAPPIAARIGRALGPTSPDSATTGYPGAREARPGTPERRAAP